MELIDFLKELDSSVKHIWFCIICLEIFAIAVLFWQHDTDKIIRNQSVFNVDVGMNFLDHRNEISNLWKELDRIKTTVVVSEIE